jgi:hypothetical protein
MAMMKDYLMQIEERVYDALELGFAGVEDIYAYVYMYEKVADVKTVDSILETILGDLDESEIMNYNSNLR